MAFGVVRPIHVAYMFQVSTKSVKLFPKCEWLNFVFSIRHWPTVCTHTQWCSSYPWTILWVSLFIWKHGTCEIKSQENAAQSMMDVGPFFFNPTHDANTRTQPNHHIGLHAPTWNAKRGRLYCKTSVFTFPLFREFFDHVAFSKIKKENVYL